LRVGDVLVDKCNVSADSLTTLMQHCSSVTHSTQNNRYQPAIG